MLEPLVRCHRKNGKLTAKHKYLLDSEQLVKGPVEGEKGFAPGVCEKVISFGENLNLSSEGDPGYLLGIYMNSLGFLDETVDFSRKVLKVNQGKVNRDNQNNISDNKQDNPSPSNQNNPSPSNQNNISPKNKKERVLFMSGGDFLKRELANSQQRQKKERKEIFEMARELKRENRDIERRNRLKAKRNGHPGNLRLDLSKEIEKLNSGKDEHHRGLVEDGEENSSFNEDDDEVAQDKKVDNESENEKRALGDDGDEVDNAANDDGDDDEVDSDKKVDSESENDKRRLTYYDFLYKTFDFDPKKSHAKGEVVKRKLEKCAKGKNCPIKAKKSKILRRRLDNDSETKKDDDDDGEKE